jgi:hypothetical protein
MRYVCFFSQLESARLPLPVAGVAPSPNYPRHQNGLVLRVDQTRRRMNGIIIASDADGDPSFPNDPLHSVDVL